VGTLFDILAENGELKFAATVVNNYNGQTGISSTKGFVFLNLVIRI
jgi:hypothetical protein